MKCVKCGYVSFDYLSECKKCRASLTTARQGFGFLSGKPAVPSLLASLLSDYEHPARQENSPVETEMFTSFSFGEEIGDGFRQERPENGVEETASVIVNPDESEEDFSLLDLSDEELELLMEKESTGSGEMEAFLPGSDMHGEGMRLLKPLSAAEPAPPAFEISSPEGETPPTAVPAPGEPAQNFDNYSLELESKTEFTPTPTPTLEMIPKFMDDPAGLKDEPEAPAEFNPGSEQVWPLFDDPTNDFVIELSENDLEALLDELGSTPKGTA